MAKPLRRFIEVIFDRTKGRKAEEDAKRSVSKIDAALGKLKGAAVAAGAALAAAFAVRKIVQGIREVTRAALDSERIWNRLSGTLKTIGIDFEDVEFRVKAAARAMQDTTTVGDEEFADTLQQLTIISGDFEQSLRNVAVVADVAAGAQIDLSTAADLVGRAMVGETGTLKRYGIIVEEGADAVETMREQFRGLAENEAKTFAGRLDQLKNEIGDFKEELGAFITQSKIAAGTIEFLTKVIKGATEAVRRLRETDRETAARLAAEQVAGMTPDELLAEQRRLFPEVNRLRAEETRLLALGERITAAQAARLADVQSELGVVAEQYAAIVRQQQTLQQLPGLSVSAEDAATAAKNAADAHERLIDNLIEGANLRQLTTVEENRLLLIEQQINAELARGNVPLERRLELLERAAQLREASRTIQARRTPTPTAPVGLTGPSVGVVRPFVDTVVGSEPLRRHRAQQMMEFLEGIEQQAVGVAANMTGAFESFFSGFIDGIAQGQNAVEAFAKGFEGLGRFIAAQLASGLAQFYEAKAAAAIGEALLGNPAAIGAAVQFSLAAGLFRALEGFASGRRGSRGATGAGLPRSDGGLSRGTTAGPPPPDITLILQGDFNAFDNKFVTAVHTATTEGIERIGKGRVRLQMGGR